MSESLGPQNNNDPLSQIISSLCMAIDGNYDSFIDPVADDPRLNQLAMLTNAIIDSTRNSVNALQEKNMQLSIKTEELNIVNTNLINEIQEKEVVQAKLAELHEEMLASSRKAGIAETAAEILYNVGNSLNQTTSSLEYIEKMVHDARFGRFIQALEVYRHRIGDSELESDDPVSDKLIKFIGQLSFKHLEFKTDTLTECLRIRKTLEHIANVIQTQQHLAGDKILLEDCNLEAIINQSLEFLINQ